MILLDLSHDSWENEAQFVKIGAKVLDSWFDNFFCQRLWVKIALN